MLTLELGSNCSSDGTCKGGRQICQATVLDEAWAKKQTLKKDNSHCADREPNAPLAFIGKILLLLGLFFFSILFVLSLYFSRFIQRNCLFSSCK